MMSEGRSGWSVGCGAVVTNTIPNPMSCERHGCVQWAQGFHVERNACNKRRARDSRRGTPRAQRARLPVRAARLLRALGRRVLETAVELPSAVDRLSPELGDRIGADARLR